MSRLAELLQPSIPAGITIPEPLERAWSWMEAQGFGVETAHGYVLTPYAGRAELGIVFSATESLAGWFEPGEPGHDRLLPLGQTDGTGSFAALWLDPAGVQRFVLLGSEGERLHLADDAVDLLRLVAIGYRELNDYSLPEEPDEDEDGESVSALADFRAWVGTELGVEVPPHWEVREPDPFAAWVAEVRGESPFEPAPAAAVTAPEVDPAEVVAACEELLTEPGIEGIRFGRRRGFALTTAAWGHELEVIHDSGESESGNAALVAGPIAAVRAALVARWGEPRPAAAVERSWAADFADVHRIDTVDLWDVADDVVVGLFSSVEEWTQVAVVVERRAVDSAHRY